MDRFFAIDSPMMRFLNRMADLLMLNFLMIFCCVPIITTGAAFTALFYVLLKMARKEEGYLFRGFFKSFKQNFRQATVLWLLMLLITAVYVGDYLIFTYSGLEIPKVVMILILAVAIMVMAVAVYIFPVLARFDNTIKNTVKNSFFMAFLNLPKTFLLMLLFLLPIAILFLLPQYGIVVIMFGISLPAYLSAHICSGIFKKFEPEAEQVKTDYEFSINTDEGNEGKNE
ncbi:MAG: YesL family protein [Lachnospiraceae bacterium]|nr:YesL family protein [Lachnospiraceae bacterium]